MLKLNIKINIKTTNPIFIFTVQQLHSKLSDGTNVLKVRVEIELFKMQSCSVRGSHFPPVQS